MRRIVLFCLIVINSTLLHAQFASVGKLGKGSTHHTQITLLADVKAVVPGVPFTAGVLLQMDKGWHTYWQYAGEAGLPTKIKWMLPPGFSAGEIQWPLPHKYNESGDVLTYGYETETMLLVRITPAKNLPANKSVTLKAEVDWLECEKLCVPGDATAELNLPVASSSERNNAGLFDKYVAQIPKPFDKDPHVAIKTSAGKGKVSIKVQSKVPFVSAPPDFYPYPLGDITIGRTRINARSTEVTLTVPLSSAEKFSEPLILRGVVLYQFETGERTVGVIEIPLSKEFLATIPANEAEADQISLLDQEFHAIETEQARQPLYMYVLFAIAGGLLLNIMPCVLPVIALKIFGLVKMAGSEPRQVKKLGWFFSLGILVSFLSLALLVAILKVAGESVGWGFQFQEPLFVIAMSAVVFAFGLSLFGVFEINLPGFAIAGASAIVGKNDGRVSYLGSFSEGVFATILATPCTAPVLGTALGFAFAQPAYVAFLIFGATGFGMALPYLILTAKPAWMKFLPKPGAWMETAKQFMGFLMMATVIWLLYVLGKQLGMEAVIRTVTFLLFIGVAFWLIGRFATLSATRVKYFGVWSVALLIIAAGYYFFIEDILKARDVLAAPTSGQAAGEPTSDGITWEPFSLDVLESHLRENRTVLIDFTAEWCLTCKVNEKTVLTNERVVESVRSNKIIALRADWTNKNETIAKLLAKFGRSGVPLYVIFPAGKPTEPIVLPEVITRTIVLEAIAKATGVRH